MMGQSWQKTIESSTKYTMIANIKVLWCDYNAVLSGILNQTLHAGTLVIVCSISPQVSAALAE